VEIRYHTRFQGSGEHKIKVKVKQSRYRPGVAKRVPEVKVPRFHDNGTRWW
jgi:hypothetical protein